MTVELLKPQAEFVRYRGFGRFIGCFLFAPGFTAGAPFNVKASRRERLPRHVCVVEHPAAADNHRHALAAALSLPIRGHDGMVA
jgi:hypothetical protein